MLHKLEEALSINNIFLREQFLLRLMNYQQLPQFVLHRVAACLDCGYCHPFPRLLAGESPTLSSEALLNICDNIFAGNNQIEPVS